MHADATNVTPTTPTLNDNTSTDNTSTLAFDDNLANFLRSEYPRKSAYLESNEWDATEVPKQSMKHLQKSARSTLILLRTLSNNSTQIATDVVNILLHSCKMCQNKELFKGIETEIALNIKEYFTTLIKSSKTRKHKMAQDKIDLIMCAATNNSSND